MQTNIANPLKTFHKYLSCNSCDIQSPPIWLMRQAGRYLPEYQAIRQKAGSFLQLCKNPDLATTVSLQPLKRFKLDAAIVFNDILVVPEAMGLELDFIENIGPVFHNYIQTPDDIKSLKSWEEISENLEFSLQTIKNISTELDANKSLIGFAGSPFTLACYMLEGKSSKNLINPFPKIQSWINDNPDQLSILLQKLADIVSAYSIAQIVAGADTIMIFDSWGGILNPMQYQKYSFKFMQYIAKQIKVTHSNIPLIAFSKSQNQPIDSMYGLLNNSDYDIIGVDHNIDISYASTKLANKAIQGNFNPETLANGDRKLIATEAKSLMKKVKNSPHNNRYIFNLGHGVLPHTNPADVEYLIETIRSC